MTVIIVRPFLPKLEAPSWRLRRMADDGLLEAVRGLHLACMHDVQPLSS